MREGAIRKLLQLQLKLFALHHFHRHHCFLLNLESILCYPVLMISKLVVLLVTCNLLVCRVSSLKLTPVQRTKHRLDIHEECEKFLSAVQNAHNKVLEDEMNVVDQRVTLGSDELKKLRLLVNRWNSIDDKLRDINALSATQNKVSQ